jgi:hypothetical protein
MLRRFPLAALALVLALLTPSSALPGGEGDLVIVYTANTFGHATPCAT